MIMKKQVFKIIGIVFLIIILALIISMSVFFAVHIANDFDLLEGQYLNETLTVDIKENQFVLIDNNVRYDFDILNKKENIVMLERNDKEYYVLIYDTNILYLDWLKEYVYYVK